MTHHFRLWLLVAAVTGLTVSGVTPGRAEDAPGTGAAAQPETLPTPQTARPPAFVLPPAPAEYPCVDVDWGNGNPLLERPDGPSPGLYFDAEADVVAVHLRNQLIDSIPIAAARTDTIQFPGNELNTAVAPRFELGYTLPDGLGSIQLGYRFLVTQGSDLVTAAQASVADPLPNGALQQGRFNLNQLDIDYVIREYSLAPCLQMRWGVGVQVQWIYFNSRLQLLSPAAAAGTTLAQSEANYDAGAGPHALLELDWQTPMHGLAVFGRIQGAGTWDEIVQTYTEQLVSGAGVPGFVRDRIVFQVGLPMLSEDVGLSYTLPRCNQSRILAGYHYETWFDIGHLGFVDSPRAQMDDQGLFLRLEVNF